MTKNITVKIDTYVKDWVEKWVYETIGTLIEKDNGEISIRFRWLSAHFLKQIYWYKRDWRANVRDKEKKEINPEKDSIPEEPF